MNADPAVDFVRRTSPTALKLLVVLGIFRHRNGSEACASLQWVGWASDVGTATVTRTVFRLEQDGLVEVVYIAGDKHARLTAAAAQLDLPGFLPGESHQIDDSLGLVPTTTTVKYLIPPPVDNSAPEKVSHQNDDSLLPESESALFADQTARLLARLGGVDYWSAREDVLAALAAKDTRQDVLEQVEHWGEWCALKGIAPSGVVIARNVRSGDLCELGELERLRALSVRWKGEQ